MPMLAFAFSACLFTSCDDDRAENPTLQTPSTFKLNQPAYSTQEIDLAHSSTLNFTWSQPDYGFPAAASYQMQVSTSDKFTVSFEEAELDESKTKVPDYANIDQIFEECKGSINAENMAKALQQIAQWPEGSVPATQEVYARVMAVLSGDTIYSNSVKFLVNPYYVELKDANPVVWYLVGGCIADGGWTNAPTAIGTSMIPMFVKAGVDYDKKTGTGEIEYTGYFPADGAFKIVQTPGVWEVGFSAGSWNGDTYEPTLRNGADDPGDIKLGEAGYYTITVNTEKLTCKIKKADITPKVYATMALPGDYNGWDQNAFMTAVETFAGAKNHVWTATVTLTDNGCKFNNGDDWFGSDAFPFGIASTSASGNIPTKAGNYLVIFNDITGGFSFIEK